MGGRRIKQTKDLLTTKLKNWVILKAGQTGGANRRAAQENVLGSRDRQTRQMAKTEPLRGPVRRRPVTKAETLMKPGRRPASKAKPFWGKGRLFVAKAEPSNRLGIS